MRSRPEHVDIVEPPAAGVAERYPDELHYLLLPDPEDADDLARKLRACALMREHDVVALRRFSDDLRARTWDDMAADVERLIEANRRSAASQTKLVSTA